MTYRVYPKGNGSMFAEVTTLKEALALMVLLDQDRPLVVPKGVKLGQEAIRAARKQKKHGQN